MDSELPALDPTPRKATPVPKAVPRRPTAQLLENTRRPDASEPGTQPASLPPVLRRTHLAPPQPLELIEE